MSFFGPFVATWVLTMASLALIVVLRSDKAEADRRGMLSQLASLLGWFWAASMPIFCGVLVLNMAEGAADGGHDYAFLGIVAGVISGFMVLGRAALLPKRNNQANKP
jgi:hypothetical protein